MRALSDAYKKAQQGDIIELLYTDRAIEAPMRKWCKRTGNEISKWEPATGEAFVAVIHVAGKKEAHLNAPGRKKRRAHLTKAATDAAR
jgi:TusA-related sulfurtransferase